MATVGITAELVDKVTGPAKSAEKSLQSIAKAAGLIIDKNNRLRDTQGRIVKIGEAMEMATKSADGLAFAVDNFNRKVKSGWLGGKTGGFDPRNPFGLFKGRGGAAMGSPLGKTGALRRQEALLKSSNTSLMGMAGRAGLVFVAFQAVTAAASAIARALARGLALVVKTAAWAQKTRIGFQMVTGGVNAGNAAMGKALKLASRYGLDVKKTTDQFKKLLAMQFSVGEASDIVKMAADMQALGMGAEASERVIRAMTQIRSKAKLQAEEMMQLAEAGISMDLVYKALGDQLGKTRDEIIKMQQAGKINDKQGLKAIKQAVLYKLRINEVGDAADKQAKTLQGMFARLRAMGQASLIELAEKVMPGLQKAFAPIFKEIMDWAKSPGAKRLMQDVADGIVGLANAAAGAWPLIKELGRMMADLFSQGKQVVSMISAQEKAMSKLMGFEVSTLDGFLTVIYGIAKALQVLIQVTAGFYAIFIAPIFQGISLLTTLLSKASESLMGLGSKMFSVGKSMMDGLVKGIKSAAGAVVSSVTGVVGNAISSAKALLGIASPSKVFESMGAMSALGYQQGFGDVGASIPAMSASAVAPSFGRGGNNVTQTNNNTFNVTEAQSAEETARMVKRMQLLEMANAFEQMAIEVGS